MADDDSASAGKLTESTNPGSSNPADASSTSQGQLGESTAHVTRPKSQGDAPEAPDASAADEIYDGEDYNAAVDQDEDNAQLQKTAASPVRPATAVGLVFIVALAGLVGWEAFRANQSHQADEQRNLFLQIGRQAALNLTTVSYTEAEAEAEADADADADASLPRQRAPSTTTSPRASNHSSTSSNRRSRNRWHCH